MFGPLSGATFSSTCSPWTAYMYISWTSHSWPRLSRAYPHIDTYGEPQPDPSLGLHYRGYAASSVLRDYQFGLITCIDDPLRRDGISAKHLSYLAAGLPVLVPACGPQHRTCLAARASDEAFAAAQRLARDTMLRPLESVLALATGSRAPSA